MMSRTEGYKSNGVGRKDGFEVGEEVAGPCRLVPKPAEVDLSTRNECARR